MFALTTGFGALDNEGKMSILIEYAIVRRVGVTGAQRVYFRYTCRGG